MPGATRLRVWAPVALLLIGPGGISALDPVKAVTQYGLSSWQIEQGLPENAVWAIAQTGDGYLWIGTEDGLARFDGSDFRLADGLCAGKLGSNYVRALLEDTQGSLWIATYGGGLSRLKEGKITSYSSRDGLTSDKVLALYEDREATLWIGTDAGLNRLRGGRISAITTRNGLSSDRVFAICHGSDGSLWIGTNGGGIDRLKDGSIQVFTTRDGLSSDLVRCLLADEDGTIWAGTEKGLNMLRGGRISALTTRDGLPSDWVHSLLRDREGALWIGTDGGLARLLHGRITVLRSRHGLASENVRSLYQDREGSLWIGTYGGGLNRLRDGKFTPLTTEEGLAHNLTWGLCEDSDGSILIGTYGGLSRLKDGVFRTYTTADGLSKNNVICLYADTKGTVWIGTDGGGLNALRGGRFTTYTTREGLSHDRVSCIFEDTRGGLWIGTFGGGLNRREGGKFTVYTTKEGLSNNSVSFVHRDRSGVLWIGTSGGLNRFENGEFTALTTGRGRSSDLLNSVYEDHDGNLWIGTQGGGVALLRHGTLTFFTTSDGLFHDAVLKILEDGNGNLWMSCNKGIFTVPKKDLLDFAEKRIDKLHCVEYGVPDGMKRAECNGGMQSSGLKSRDGRLWFSTIHGVVVIDPAATAINRQAPPVAVEEILVDDATVPLDLVRRRQELQLAPGAERLEFHFMGLSLLAPERVRYQYKLDGFDRQWVDAGHRRTAYYTRIPPGRYTFRVKACNGDGVWNEEGASAALHVLPRFYQTPWFYGICLAAAMLAAWGLYAARIRQIRMRFMAVLAERLRISRDIHDTVTQGLVSVSIQLDSIERAWGASHDLFRQGLDRARHLVNGSLAEVRRSVSDLRSVALMQGDLVRALGELARESAAGTHIRVDVNMSGATRALPYHVEANLLRIAQEAMTNAIRHSGGSSLRVELAYERQRVRLSVRDDGRGFSEAAREGHYGLLGMRERAEALGGCLAVRSSEGEGTEIEAVVPDSEKVRER